MFTRSCSARLLAAGLASLWLTAAGAQPGPNLGVEISAAGRRSLGHRHPAGRHRPAAGQG